MQKNNPLRKSFLCWDWDSNPAASGCRLWLTPLPTDPFQLLRMKAMQTDAVTLKISQHQQKKSSAPEPQPSVKIWFAIQWRRRKISDKVRSKLTSNLAITSFAVWYRDSKIWFQFYHQLCSSFWAHEIYVTKFMIFSAWFQVVKRNLRVIH